MTGKIFSHGDQLQFMDAARNGYETDIATFLAEGYPPDLHLNAPETAFVAAARNGRSNIMRLLLEHGADVNAQNEDGKCALHLVQFFMACESLTKIILAHRPDLNIQDKDGDTPLHSAVSLDEPRLVHYYLNNGANTHIRNNKGQLPEDVAREMDKQDIVSIIETARSKRHADRVKKMRSRQITGPMR